MAVCGLYGWLEDWARLFGEPVDQLGREPLFQQSAAMDTTMTRRIAALIRRLAQTLRRFPFPVYLWDLRRRIAPHGQLL